MSSAAPLYESGAGPEPFLAPVTPAVARSRTKRAIDAVGALVLVVVLLPVALLIALLIKLDSRGPALFHQERVGLRGRRFVMLKFRSMATDCDDAPHRAYVRTLLRGDHDGAEGTVYKLVDDPRVTRIGRFLRRTSLDELPQLLNVIRGEMSLVGPRPPLPYEVEEYDDVQWGRLACRPGLTGLWQVSGRNELSYRSMVELDLEYIERWNLALDVRILLLTIPVVVSNSGSAH